MTDLTPNHPAVEAAGKAWGETRPTGAATWDEMSERLQGIVRARMVAALNAALPRLTADDLRDTDVAEEIRTEGWMQGWAAGRDLDGDEDATPYLRDTPAGRALMAEGWDEGARATNRAWDHAHDGHPVDPDFPYYGCQTCDTTNPYRGSVT